MDTTTTLRAGDPALTRGVPTRTAGRTAARRPWRLGGPARKATLLVHILAGGIWMGVDVIVGALVLGAWLSDDAGVDGVVYQALGMFVLGPMLVAGLVCLASGVLLGLGSRYGLIRYTWVAVKLALNVVLCVLILVLLRPTLAQVSEYGRDLTAGVAVAEQDVSALFFPPVVSLIALVFASWLSIFKPWGRLRSTR